MDVSALRCTLPSRPPLVSLIVLTCNRHAFLRLSLHDVARQSYPQSSTEVIVVDDGPREFPRTLLLREAQLRGLRVRFVRLSARSSIGQKRNAGFRAARGEVLLHWDDDDLHHPDHIASLVCPIVTNVSEMTALTFSFLAKLSRKSARFYAWGSGRGGHGHPAGPFLGSLAFHRSVAATTNAPFPDVSLSEDLYFVERALSSCNRMLPLAGVPLVYTRHSSASNTWQANLTGRMTNVHATSPPAFVTAPVLAAYISAERDAARRDACKPIRRHPPPDIQRPLRYPYLLCAAAVRDPKGGTLESTGESPARPGLNAARPTAALQRAHAQQAARARASARICRLGSVRAAKCAASTGESTGNSIRTRAAGFQVLVR